MGKKLSVSVSGCSSILGLPFPNGWPNELLREKMPDRLLCSVLSHIAHLLDSVCKILNVCLPHELKPFDTFECAFISSARNQHELLPLTGTLGLSPREEGGAFSFDSKRRPSRPSKTTELFPNAETTRDEEKNYESSPQSDGLVNDRFVEALHNLMGNILVAATMMGVHHSDLWPKECMLLNLGVIQAHCKTMVEKLSLSYSFGSVDEEGKRGLSRTEPSHICELAYLYQRRNNGSESRNGVDKHIPKDINEDLVLEISEELHRFFQEYEESRMETSEDTNQQDTEKCVVDEEIARDTLTAWDHIAEEEAEFDLSTWSEDNCSDWERI